MFQQFKINTSNINQTPVYSLCIVKLCSINIIKNKKKFLFHYLTCIRHCNDQLDLILKIQLNKQLRLNF